MWPRGEWRFFGSGGLGLVKPGHVRTPLWAFVAKDAPCFRSAIVLGRLCATLACHGSCPGLGVAGGVCAFGSTRMGPNSTAAPRVSTVNDCSACISAHRQRSSSDEGRRSHLGGWLSARVYCAACALASGRYGRWSERARQLFAARAGGRSCGVSDRGTGAGASWHGPRGDVIVERAVAPYEWSFAGDWICNLCLGGASAPTSRRLNCIFADDERRDGAGTFLDDHRAEGWG